MKAIIMRQPHVILGAITICAMFFSGCDLFTYKRPFDDAYYNNNFIANIGFDQFVGGDDISTLPLPDLITGVIAPITGQWDFSFRYQSWDNYGYMTLNPTNLALDPGLTADDFGTAPSGLASTAPVYRLELVNLMAGGDFETTEGGIWSGPIVGSPGTWNRVETIPFSDMWRMRIGCVSPQSVLFTPSFIGVPLVTTYAYKTVCRYETDNDVGIYMDGKYKNTLYDGTGIWNDSFGGTNVTPLYSFQALPNSSFSGFFLDDFKVVRTGNMTLRLLLLPAETNPALEPGVYTFSVWVATDPLANAGESPYRLDAFTLSMRPTPATTYLASSSAVYAPAAGWTQMTVTLSGNALQFNASLGATSPVIELVIDCDASGAGRVLLAQPELRFRPDFSN